MVFGCRRGTPCPILVCRPAAEMLQAKDFLCHRVLEARDHSSAHFLTIDPTFLMVTSHYFQTRSTRAVLCLPRRPHPRPVT